MSQENNQTEVKSSFSYTIETKEYPGEIIKILKEKNIPFKATKYRELIQDQQDIDEGLPLIEIPKEIYKDLDDLCKINNWDTNEKVIEILGDAVFSAEITENNGILPINNTKMPKFDPLEVNKRLVVKELKEQLQKGINNILHEVGSFDTQINFIEPVGILA